MVGTGVEGFVEIGGRKTWYRVTGEPTGRPPLLMLHGGPGACSPEDTVAVARVAEQRQVFVYDQIDAGRSERVNDRAKWTVEAHVAELAAVRAALGLDEVHLFGQSWGGMLAMSYALTKPKGLRSLVVASAPASAPRWSATAVRLREELPGPTKRALTRCERTVLRSPITKSSKMRTTQDLMKKAKGMQKALPLVASAPMQRLAALASYLPPLRRSLYPILTVPFMTRYGFRGTAMPAGMLVAMAGMNQAVYESMWGPSEFVATGTLKNFDLSDQLDQIDVPVLLTSGKYECADPDQVRDMAEAMPRSEWVLFEDAAHCSEFEEPERYAAVLTEFLARADAQ